MLSVFSVRGASCGQKWHRQNAIDWWTLTAVDSQVRMLVVSLCVSLHRHLLMARTLPTALFNHCDNNNVITEHICQMTTILLTLHLLQSFTTLHFSIQDLCILYITALIKKIVVCLLYNRLLTVNMFYRLRPPSFQWHNLSVCGFFNKNFKQYSWGNAETAYLKIICLVIKYCFASSSLKRTSVKYCCNSGIYHWK